MTTRLEELTFSVADILGKPGHRQDVAIRARVPEVGVALARLDDAPVSADLTAESVVEGVLVTGRIQAPAVFECARCLTAFRQEVATEVCELFVAPGHEAAAGEDAYRVSGGEIDLEPMVRDTLTLGLPLNPLCREACRGLCGGCGRDLNQGQCVCKEDATDPRWAPLAALRQRLET